MASVAKQQDLVKKSLVHFVSAHIPKADFSVVDEIVLTYIISILGEGSQDPCFEVDDFVEMMSAYFSEFSTIDQSVICEWIYKLSNELMELEKNADNHDLATFSMNSLSISDIIPEPKLRTCTTTTSTSTSLDREETPNESSGGYEHKRSHHLSETSDGGSTDSSSNCDFYLNEAEVLQEMFPDSAYAEVKHCIAIGKGDINNAAQILLHRQETGQSLLDKNNGLTSRKNVVIVDDAELKNRIIARYSYVDKDSSNREYKPIIPKMEPKKLVRYRDNKIVSLKGERYTEVKRDEEAELKKPKRPIQP